MFIFQYVFQLDFLLGKAELIVHRKLMIVQENKINDSRRLLLLCFSTKFGVSIEYRLNI